MLIGIILKLLVPLLFIIYQKYKKNRRNPTKTHKMGTSKNPLLCRKEGPEKRRMEGLEKRRGGSSNDIRCKVCLPPTVHEETLLQAAEDERIPNSDCYFPAFLGHNTAAPFKVFLDLVSSESLIAVSCVERLGLLERVNWTENRMFTDSFGVRYTYGTLHVPVRTSSGFLLLEEISVGETPNGAEAILGQDFFWDHPCQLLVQRNSTKLQVGDKDSCRLPNVLVIVNYSTDD